MNDISFYTKTKPADITKNRDIEIEIFSFPISIMLVAATENSFIKSKYALAEAKRVSELLKDENEQKIFEIAQALNWDVKKLENSSPYVFSLKFSTFLKHSTGFQDKTWKLVNQKMIDGEVYLTKQKLSRLLEEGMRRYVETRLDTKLKALPQTVMVHITRLRQLAEEKQEQIRLEQMPDRVVMEAFPPCIKGIYDSVSAGRPASHMGRFALTSFMLSVGMSEEDVFKFFRSVSDFNERMTRYQVEHIAGSKGSGTKYTPPNCSTLRTHGICVSPEPECEGAINPLVCYKRKLENVPEEEKQSEKQSTK